MKRIICILLTLIIALTPQIVYAEEPVAQTTEILLETTTGQVLYSKNADEKRPMASITKEMCLLIWAEMLAEGRLTLEESVKASPYASSAEGSVIWLEAGEEMTVAELLEAIIVSSANDACIALAEHTAGSEAQFVKQMNARAKEMGLSGTRYTNCVGYDDNGHYSTARDIAVLTAELMTHEVYRGWQLTWLDYLRDGQTQLVNTNKLIRYYDGILGGKTGTTDGAGYCLSACAERGDLRLVAVTLGCSSDEERFDSTEELLDYGFNGFEKFTPETDPSKLLPIKVVKGTSDKVTPVITDSNRECVIKKGRSADVQYEYTFVEELIAPVSAGQFVGEYLVTLDGTEVFRADITAATDVEKMDFLRCLWLVLTEMIQM